MTPKDAERLWCKLYPFLDIEGEEKERMMVIIALLEPLYSSNNQYSISYHYELAGVEYTVTHLPDRPEPVLSYRAHDENGNLLHPNISH